MAKAKARGKEPPEDKTEAALAQPTHMNSPFLAARAQLQKLMPKKPEPAPHKKAPPAPVKRPPEPPARQPSDEELFLKEMWGVRRIDPGHLRPKDPVAPPPRPKLSEEAEVLAELADLCDGVGPWDIADSDEFIEGLAPGIDRRLLARLRQGEFALRGHIDLHGKTSEEARIAIERFVFLRIYERDLTFSMITSFGILIGGVGIIKHFWGLVPRPVPVPLDAQVAVLGTEIPLYRVVVIGIALLVYCGIWLFLNKTIIGKAIRAGIENVEHVEGLGINVYRLFTISFVMAGALSGLAGGLHAPLIMVDPQMGLEVLAFAFMIVIIGGLGSIKGTLVSAFLVGQAVSLGSLLYAPLAQMAPFGIMMLILIVRPSGLFGSALLNR